jgi:5-methylcytosine-specific restriction endonuclease McrA
MEICTKCKSKNIGIDKHYRFHDIYNCNDCHYWTYQQIADCCRDPFKIVVVDEKDYPHYFIREQCTHCGGCINKAKPLNKKQYSDQIRGELDQHSDQDFKNERSQEKEIIRSLKGDYNAYNSPQYKYYLYRCSQTWKDKRQKVHDRDKNICQLCKIEASEEVHHLTYKNIFKEPLEDLIAVCTNCHRKEHTKPTIEQINQGYDHEASI